MPSRFTAWSLPGRQLPNRWKRDSRRTRHCRGILEDLEHFDFGVPLHTPELVCRQRARFELRAATRERGKLWGHLLRPRIYWPAVRLLQACEHSEFDPCVEDWLPHLTRPPLSRSTLSILRMRFAFLVAGPRVHIPGRTCTTFSRHQPFASFPSSYFLGLGMPYGSSRAAAKKR